MGDYTEQQVIAEDMTEFICTKKVHAEPMDYHTAGKLGYVRDYENSDIPQEQDGYRVVYKDGYTSWSPKKAFDDGYKKITNLDQAIIEDTGDNDSDDESMPKWFNRLLEEESDLSSKIVKLEEYLTPYTNEHDYSLLRKQSKAMIEYKDTLKLRIERFNKQQTEGK